MLMHGNTLPRFAEKGNIVAAQRHGWSYPNHYKRIVSCPEAGKHSEHGLTEVGRDQVRMEILRLMHVFPGHRTVIVHSPFSRTEESAMIAASVIAPRAVLAHDSLRERFFGARDGGSNALYDDIWALDKNDPLHRTDGVECAAHVLGRMVNMLHGLHETHENTIFLLVGHGDPLQITETAFRGLPVSMHRSIRHWRNGEIRILTDLQQSRKRKNLQAVRHLTTSLSHR